MENHPNENTTLAVAIDRNHWLRGRTGGGLLRNPLSGNCCATGWACLTAGMSPLEIDNERSISSLQEKGADLPDKLNQLLQTTSEATEMPDPRFPDNAKARDYPAALMFSINDDGRLEDEEREAMLIGLGRTVGLEFSFHGQPLPTRGNPEHESQNPERGDQDWDGYSKRTVMATVMTLNQTTRIWEMQEKRATQAPDALWTVHRFGYAELQRKAARRQSQVVRVIIESTNEEVLYDAYLEPGEDVAA